MHQMIPHSIKYRRKNTMVKSRFLDRSRWLDFAIRTQFGQSVNHFVAQTNACESLTNAKN